MREGVLHPHAVLVVEAENLVVCIAQVRHLLRPALAHADAVSVAPDSQNKRLPICLDRPEFVFRRVNGQIECAFQLAENVERQRQSACFAIHKRRHVKIQLRI